MVQESAIEQATETTIGKIETAVIDTLSSAKEFIKGSYEAMAETLDVVKESLIGSDIKEKVKAPEVDLRTEEERFKASLHKVRF